MKTAALFLAAALVCGAAQITAGTQRLTSVVPVGTLHPMRIALGTFADLERHFDGKLSSLGGVNEPVDMLGTTRGIYLEGYGAVFTAELSLVVTPSISPFRQTISPELRAQIHQKKVARVPMLKQAMQEMLKTAAMTLIQVPDTQQLVFAVRLDYLKWEDTMGLPGLIVMKADRKSALAGIFQTDEQ